jgi:hypothetical protein
VRGAPLVLILVAATAAEAQQQGSLQVSTDTQILSGDPQRRGQEHPFEPDIGMLWTQPGNRYGQFQMEMHGSRRGEDFHLGRTWLALRDTKIKGLSWTFEGGDLYTSANFGDARFTNLSAPAITFTGGAAHARSAKMSLAFVAGRSTAWRNIFGTDPDSLGQTLAIGRAGYQLTPRIQLTGHASRVRTKDLGEFPKTIDASDQGGGGMSVAVLPSLHLVADGSFVRYRATGAARTVNDYSYLGGAHLLLSRGWVQVNATRFSPGDLPVLNAALTDRSGVFTAGEYDVLSRLRMFGGWETLDTNIKPTGTALQRPEGSTTRQFAGGRVRLAARTTFSIRVEDGGRVSKPVLPGLPIGLAASTSDTGSRSAELQTSIGRVTAFGRYSRRENVDSTFTSATYTQDDTAAQFYMNLSRTTQLFGMASRMTNRPSDGRPSTYLQFSAGGQQQLVQGLWMRVEGTRSRNEDVATGLFVPRTGVSVGLNGQISRNTVIGFNTYVDRAPVGFPGDPQAWLARSTVRVVHSIPTGSVRVSSTTATAARAARGSGTVSGSVFADWNANGQPDPGEEVLEGIPIALGTVSHVTTGHDGQFSFLNVPAGVQLVRLDLHALPVDFDAPATTDITLELSRGESRRVAFGLLPLGTIHGRVFEDSNRNGVLDSGEPPVDGAVLVLDGGQRSELARKGQFRFDAVRAGDHVLQLLKESLPEGAAIVGEAERPLSIAKTAPTFETIYLVTIEKRPELRKVFPPKGGGGTPNAAARPGNAASRTANARAANPGPRASTVAPRSNDQDFTIQVAALTAASTAHEVAADLKRNGFDAYVVEPSAAGDGLYRVRVGTYLTRTAAQRTVARLESQLGLKLWVTRK